MKDVYIANTHIGEAYGWKRLSQVDPDRLRQNRAHCMSIVTHPEDFPLVDLAYCEEHIKAIDEFFFQHNDLVRHYA